MNHKQLLSVGFIILLAGLLIGAQTQREQKPNQPNQSGRFQVYQMSYELTVNNTSMHETGVFRIDNETGTTWKYLAAVNSQGQMVDAWVMIVEPRSK